MPEAEAKPNPRRQFAFELLINGVLPFVLYYVLKNHYGFSDYSALLWATIVPAVAVVVGLLKEKRLDPVAMITLVVLGLSVALAAATDDPRLLQLRESYLSAALGGAMLLSAMVGKPALGWLAVRAAPPERQPLLAQPAVQKLFGRLTWIWGALFSSELALKWWMVENLTIAQVLALGPIVFLGLTGFGIVLSIVAIKRPGKKPLPVSGETPAEEAGA